MNRAAKARPIPSVSAAEHRLWGMPSGAIRSDSETRGPDRFGACHIRWRTAGQAPAKVLSILPAQISASSWVNSMICKLLR